MWHGRRNRGRGGGEHRRQRQQRQIGIKSWQRLAFAADLDYTRSGREQRRELVRAAQHAARAGALEQLRIAGEVHRVAKPLLGGDEQRLAGGLAAVPEPARQAGPPCPPFRPRPPPPPLAPPPPP